VYRSDPQFREVVEHAFVDGRHSMYQPSAKNEKLN
jgi:hypothetical protein